jgi:hypothetical protein
MTFFMAMVYRARKWVFTQARLMTWCVSASIAGIR